VILVVDASRSVKSGVPGLLCVWCFPPNFNGTIVPRHVFTVTRRALALALAQQLATVSSLLPSSSPLSPRHPPACSSSHTTGPRHHVVRPPVLAPGRARVGARAAHPGHHRARGSWRAVSRYFPQRDPPACEYLSSSPAAVPLLDLLPIPVSVPRLRGPLRRAELMKPTGHPTREEPAPTGVPLHPVVWLGGVLRRRSVQVLLRVS
jgi:hypothetical protein